MPTKPSRTRVAALAHVGATADEAMPALAAAAYRETLPRMDPFLSWLIDSSPEPPLAENGANPSPARRIRFELVIPWAVAADTGASD